MMNNAHSISVEIRRRLAGVRGRWLRIGVVSQGLIWIALIVSLWLFLTLSEAVFRFDSSTRTVLVLGGIAFSAVAFIWLVLRPLLRLAGVLRPPTDSELARLVGRFLPSVRDRLLNLLQLHEEASRGTLYSPELIDASFEDLSGVIQPLDFRQAVDWTPVRRARLVAGASVLIALVTAALVPLSFTDAVRRLVLFHQDFIPPPRFSFQVSPGNQEVLKGQTVAIMVKVIAAEDSPIGDEPLWLRWQPEGQTEFEERKLLADSLGFFATALENLKNNTDYFAQYQNVESEHYTLLVRDRPVIRSLQVRLDHPAYSQLPPKIQDEFVGDVTALTGTAVSISGSSSKELSHGLLVFHEGKPVPLVVRGTRFSTRFVLKTEGSYHIELRDLEDVTNFEPVSYRLTAVPDAVPSITILRPGRNLDVAGASSLPMLFQIKDDFGFSRMRLGHRLARSRYEPVANAPSYLDIDLPSSPSAVAEIPYLWDLSSLHLAPEDVVDYFAEVFDNDRVGGPKQSRTPLYTLRLPSLEEVFTDLDREHRQTTEQLTKTLQAARDLKDRIESISQDLKKNKPVDWQRQKQMEETAQKYRELQSKLDDARRQLDAIVEQMQQQKVLSTETLEKYLELQQLFEQLDSAELQKALREMQQALQALNKQQLQQALQQVTFSEERFRESIERTLDLLKRIQIEQKLDELNKRAQELTRLQQELREEGRQTEGNAERQEELARRQEDLAQKLDRLEEAAEDVQNRMEEFFTEMPERELQEANRQLREKHLGERMRQASRQLRQSQSAQAQQAQQGVQQDLQQFSDQLGAIQMQMLQQQQQFVVNELRRAISDLLELSKREEALKEQSRKAPSNSPQLRQNAQEQIRVIQDLGNIISALQELSKRSFAVTPAMGRAIGEALARMQNSMTALETRTGAAASQEQAAAMSALNQAAMQVQGALQSLLQSGGQGGGLMGQLQSLAGQQLDLNLRTQTLQDAARLAVEQEALRKSLEQLNNEARAAQEQQRILGDLDVIAKEMQEVVRNLEQNEVNPETIRKQERILSRLLDAARSTRERDFEKKRKSETGTQIVRRSPGELDAAALEGRNRLREDLLKALEQGYSKDYQELIRKYFEELQKIEDR
ncbi:MAG: hypothetical protein HYW57_09105 [Ignavibacteriales bacterium]|nr:hypothetical protein [Ignavibacteriales bacterium]